MDDPFRDFDHCNSPLGPDGTPYAYFESIRDWALENKREIGWSEKQGGFWLVAGYEAGREIFQNPAVFTNQESTLPVYATPDGRPLMVAAYDDPDHRKYRKLIQGPFSPGKAAEMADQLRVTTNELIDAFIDAGRVELVDGLANEVPSRMTAIILGLPAEQGDVYRTWTHAMAQQQQMDPDGAAANLRAMEEYFSAMLEKRKVDPGDDVLSAVVHTEVDGERLTDEEVKDFWIVLLLGGIDNTTKILSNMFWRLAWDIELRRRLLAHPELIGTAVDEFLRYYSPAMAVRVVAEPISIHGVDMEPGQFVVQALPIQNRDPRQFPNPDVFIPDRTPNRHHALGLGIHRCLGQHLIKVEARVAAEEFLRRIPEFELDPLEETEWLHGQVSGIQRLPIVFPPGGGQRPRRVALAHA